MVVTVNIFIALTQRKHIQENTMRIGEICTRDVVFCSPNTGIAEAARLMRDHHVGDLVVAIEEPGGHARPFGIITDRDIVIEVVAREAPIADLTVRDVIIEGLTFVNEATGIRETLEIMRQKGIRRMPVVNEHYELVGIVALDDLLELVAEELDSMVKLVARERMREIQHRPRMPVGSKPAPTVLFRGDAR